MSQPISPSQSYEPPPHVSVVITAYNEEKRLVETLQALREQTYKDFEVVIVDDGSTDGTVRIAREFSQIDKRFRFEILPRVGRGRALNAGVRLARGKYIAINDADDLSLPERLGKQMSFLRTHPECALLGSAASIVDEHGEELEIRCPPQDDRGLRKRLALGNPFIHSTVIYRRDRLIEAGMFSESLPCGIDYDMIVRIARLGQLSCLPEVLVLHKRHREQKFRKGLTVHRRWRTAARIAVRASWYHNKIMLPVSISILATVSSLGGPLLEKLHGLHTGLLHRPRH